jgi:hypothetical protein
MFSNIHYHTGFQDPLFGAVMFVPSFMKIHQMVQTPLGGTDIQANGWAHELKDIRIRMNLFF